MAPLAASPSIWLPPLHVQQNCLFVRPTHYSFVITLHFFVSYWFRITAVQNAAGPFYDSLNNNEQYMLTKMLVLQRTSCIVFE